jgi:hypothetical protein
LRQPFADQGRMGLGMPFVRRAVLVMCVIFAGCVVGILLQRLLPTQHIADAKSAITTIQGLVALLLALVLGLLIWTSYGVFSQQRSEAHTLGSQILQLDLALERYGPEADRGRELLKQELIATRQRFWGDDGLARLTYCESRAELRDFDGFFAALKPATDEQRRSARHGPSTLSLDRANALSDVEAAQQPHSEGAADQRGFLGDAAVLLRRRAVEHQRLGDHL